MVDLPCWDSELEIGLVLTQVLLRPGDELSYSVVNQGVAPILTGRSYSLDHREGDRWTELSLGLLFRAVGLTVSPGHRRELTARVPGDVLDGLYRLRKTVRLAPPLSADVSSLPRATLGLPIEFAAEFTVADTHPTTRD